MASQTDTSYSSQIKGIAIFAVIVLHFLTTLPTLLQNDPQHLAWFAIIDQAMRFCVPLFVAISGFGLTKKYLHVPFHLSTFVKRRVFKLLPLYILWSATALVMFTLSSSWESSISSLPLWKKLLMGRADYHLYFVPMIFQLYLLFPFLLYALKRYKRIFLGLTLLVQISAYLYFYFVVSGQISTIVELNDQRQYLPWYSWIFYFVLGMTVAMMEERKRHRYALMGFSLFSVGLLLSIQTGLSAMNPTADTIMVLRSTRFPILIYGSGVILLCLSNTWRFIQPVRGILTFFGRHSYLVYLAHPLLLRIFVGAYSGGVTTWSLILASLLLTVSFYLSLRFLKE